MWFGCESFNILYSTQILQNVTDRLSNQTHMVEAAIISRVKFSPCCIPITSCLKLHCVKTGINVENIRCVRINDFFDIASSI